MFHVLHGDFRQLPEEVLVPPTAGGRPQAHGSLIQCKAMPCPHLGVGQPFCDALDGLERTGPRDRAAGRAVNARTFVTASARPLSPGAWGPAGAFCCCFGRTATERYGSTAPSSRRENGFPAPRSATGASSVGGSENTPSHFHAEGQPFQPEVTLTHCPVLPGTARAPRGTALHSWPRQGWQGGGRGSGSHTKGHCCHRAGAQLLEEKVAAGWQSSGLLGGSDSESACRRLPAPGGPVSTAESAC